MTYILLASDISGKWDWGEGRDAARPAPATNCGSCSRSFPRSGCSSRTATADMVTPYAASRYVLDHLPPIGDPSRAQLLLYRGGHMFYIDAKSRKAFSADAKAFYQSTQ